MIPIDEELRLGATNAGCNRRRVEFVVDSTLALALRLELIGTTRLGERLHAGGAALPKSEQRE